MKKYFLIALLLLLGSGAKALSMELVVDTPQRTTMFICDEEDLPLLGVKIQVFDTSEKLISTLYTGFDGEFTLPKFAHKLKLSVIAYQDIIIYIDSGVSSEIHLKPVLDFLFLKVIK